MIINVSPSPSANRRYQEAAERLGAVAVVRTRYELDAARLPASLRARLTREGLRAIRIGSTTYRSSTWALVEDMAVDLTARHGDETCPQST